MAVNKVGGLISMGKEREDERRAAGILRTTTPEGYWVLDTDEIYRVYEVLGFDEETQSTRLLVIEEVRRGDQ